MYAWETAGEKRRVELREHESTIVALKQHVNDKAA